MIDGEMGDLMDELMSDQVYHLMLKPDELTAGLDTSPGMSFVCQNWKGPHPWDASQLRWLSRDGAGQFTEHGKDEL